MLVDAGRAIHPEIHVNVKLWAGKQSEGGIAESALGVKLARQLGRCLAPANDVPRIAVFVWVRFEGAA